MRANRFVYMLTHGEVPDNFVVCHDCDTPACVRPDHLHLNTNEGNIDERHRKGRTIGRPRKERPIATTPKVPRIHAKSTRGFRIDEIIGVESLIRRLWAKIEKDSDTGCWVWVGGFTNDYGNSPSSTQLGGACTGIARRLRIDTWENRSWCRTQTHLRQSALR